MSMNIGFSLDINYVNILINCINSIHKNNKRNNIEYYIIIDSIKTKETIIEKIKILDEKFNIFFKIFEEEDKLFYQKNTRIKGELRKDINIIHYGQILFKKYFNINKILYLEADQIVVGDLKYLFSLNIENYGIAANPIKYKDFHSFINTNKIMNYTGIKYNNEIHYFNAGVTLIDFRYFEKHNILEKFNNIVIENKKADNPLYLFYTQGVLNILFYKRYKGFDKKYNFVISDIEVYEKNSDFKDAIIIHYNGSRIFDRNNYKKNDLKNIGIITKKIYKKYDIMNIMQ